MDFCSCFVRQASKTFGPPVPLPHRNADQRWKKEKKMERKTFLNKNTYNPKSKKRKKRTKLLHRKLASNEVLVKKHKYALRCK